LPTIKIRPLINRLPPLIVGKVGAALCYGSMSTNGDVFPILAILMHQLR
jgi:hypothetical protein